MGMVNRDASVNHDGHEIALSVALTGSGLSTCQYKLYVDGQITDQQAISAWSRFFGATVTLRGQLPLLSGQSIPRKVKVIANLRLFKKSDYLFFVDDVQIHQVWATYGGL